MPFTVIDDAFATEAEAVAAIEAQGMLAYPADVEANERGLHWHDFDAVIGIVAGELAVVDESGAEFHCGPGSLLQVTDRPLHTERGTAGRFVFGFATEPTELVRPINRDPADHPSRR